MKLFCYCSSCTIKLDLPITTKSRSELSQKIGAFPQISCGSCQAEFFISVANIYAEESTSGSTVTTSVVVGTLIGIVAGPLGMSIGAGIGGRAGWVKRSNDKSAVKFFNNSSL